jgi:predicted anti-sigma-YlaC factor YlaD
MKCEVCLELLEEYLDGELAAEDHEQIDAHLIKCGECSASFARSPRNRNYSRATIASLKYRRLCGPESRRIRFRKQCHKTRLVGDSV